MRKVGVVGRDEELAALRRAVASARRRRGALVLVEGEAGIGKTALVEEALAVRGLTVLRGTAQPRAPRPLGLLVDAIRSHPAWATVASEAVAAAAGDIETDAALRALFGIVRNESDVPSPAPDRPSPANASETPVRSLLEAVCRLVVGLAHGATAVVLDDLQAADLATLDALLLLASAVERAPVLVVGLVRTDELPRGSPVRRLRVELRRAGRLRTVVLDPLDPQAVTQLATGVLGARPSADLAARLAERSQGLPLFVEELAAALVAEGAVAMADGEASLRGDDLPVPETLRDSILVRFEGLPGPVLDTLATAALLGERIDEALMAAVVGEPGAWIDAGLDRGILQAHSDTIAFRHALVREVLAEELPAPERRTRHRRIAHALAERGAEPLLVAEHWLSAGDAAAAIPCLLVAAEASCRVHAYRDAAAAFRRALEEDRGELAPRVAILERLAGCEERAGAPGEAARVWSSVAAARQAKGELGLAAEAHARRARALEVQGRWPAAIDARVAAADGFAAAGMPGAAATERLAAAAHLRSAASFAAALELVSAARSDAEAAQRPDLVARAIGLEGNVLARMGRGEDGVGLVRHGLELALQAGLAAPAAELYQRLADSLEHAGRYDPAQAAYLEGAAYCRTESLEPTAQLCLACMAAVLWQKGAWTACERTSREVLASRDATLHARAVAEGMLGMVAAARGATGRARPRLEASLRLARRIELAAMDLLSSWGLAACDLHDGDLGGAGERCRGLLDRWSSTEERHYVVPALAWAAGVFEDAGDATSIRACADALAHIAGQTAQPSAIAALSTALGSAASVEGDHAGAAARHLNALAVIAAEDLPFERALIGRRAGLALVAAGQRTQAVTAFANAARLARRLGATPLGAAIATDLATIGESVERRLGAREAARLAHRGLTRRELEVMSLVGRGLTSRDVARQLYLSPRTVEMHVGNALVKLDCRTRAEAVRSLADGGLLAPVEVAPVRIGSS